MLPGVPNSPWRPRQLTRRNPPHNGCSSSTIGSRVAETQTPFVRRHLVRQAQWANSCPTRIASAISCHW
eukprot:5979826-Alexandrium_andersonii.AAC.1